jgi:chemotaxis protein methyltransferase CheR
MMLLEEKLASWNIQILGTDYSEAVVKRAQAASFQQIEVNRGLPTSLLIKYFTRSGMDWKLSETVRRMANFRTIDLRNSMSTLGPFDLAFCRNVMIYFDDKTKRKIMKQLHGTLFRGGWLLLGGAETIFGLDDLFERKNIGSATVYIAR